MFIIGSNMCVRKKRMLARFARTVEQPFVEGCESFEMCEGA